MKIGLKMFGFEKAFAKIEAIKPSNKPTIFNNPLMKAALMAERIAKSLCPVDTGRLRSSIGVEVINTNTIFMGTNVSYAGYVEYGTLMQRPRPFIRPAAAAVTSELKRNVRLELVKEWEGA